MTHLYIELNGITEEVNSLIIEKLYNLASSGDLDETSDLKGRLHSPLSYRTQVEYLNTNYSDLHISVDDYAIPFEDPNMATYLNSIGVGSNGMITESQAAAATSVANSANTTITKFNEFKYFTNITQSKGGFAASSEGNMRFCEWTALEEVDISNLTTIGHNNGYAYGDTFSGCTSLKKVTASSNLTKIGYNAFNNCQKLDTFTGLLGTIEVWDSAFFNCKKLPQSFFQPLSFLLKGDSNEPCNFASCILLESINIAEGTTTIPCKSFWGCSKLTTVTLPSTITKIDKWAFYSCDKLSTINIPSGNITIELGAFQGCSSLTSFDLSAISIVKQDVFSGCSNMQFTNTGHVTTFEESSFKDASSLTSLEIANGAYIGMTAFENSGVTSITFKGDFTTSRYGGCFLKCRNLTSVTFETQFSYLPLRMFQECSSLVTIDLSNCLSYRASDNDPYYGSHFSQCESLENVTLSTHVNRLEDGMFGYNPIHSITIPANVTEIGKSCFYACRNLTVTMLPTTPPTLDAGNDGVYYNFGMVPSIKVPAGTLSTYLNAPGWSTFASVMSESAS